VFFCDRKERPYGSLPTAPRVVSAVMTNVAAMELVALRHIPSLEQV